MFGKKWTPQQHRKFSETMRLKREVRTSNEAMIKKALTPAPSTGYVDGVLASCWAMLKPEFDNLNFTKCRAIIDIAEDLVKRSHP